MQGAAGVEDHDGPELLRAGGGGASTDSTSITFLLQQVSPRLR